MHTYDIPLLTLGGAVITVSSVIKLLVLGALLYLLAGRFSRWTLGRLLRHTAMQAGQREAVTGLVHYVVLVVGAVVILQNAGINLTAFAVVASALGVGVGFGLQNIISNFISGLIIMLERPIEVGDRIELAGVEGVVHAIGARRTTVVTNDRIAILVPNQRFITDNVTNYVYLDRTIRLRVPVSVAQGADVRQVEQLLLQAAAAEPQVQKQPAPEVVLTSLGGAALGFELLVWYDGQACSKQQVLSRLYFAIGSLLQGSDIRSA
ncbi:mechanosensitive ion channel family protein [Ideonella sp. BN130291]|uniref:mechanosensitive ion channel family protein n=1 Tax=Ideonella sp. BN130291 TaxID=3112940 RepID=UPI002E25EF83|nr:mechanosensitive ion channel domain-containing protein [Ideonella sp. BN130291]